MLQDNANFYASSAYSSYDYSAAAAVGPTAAQGFGDAWMHVPHSGSPAGTGLGVGTLPQYSNITCLTTAVGNGNLNGAGAGAGGGSQTPPMAHSTLGMSAPAPGSPGAALQSDYAPTASLVAAAGYSYATSGSGFENGKCASLGVRVNQRLSSGRGEGREH